LKLAKSRNLAPAPDCSGNPSPSPTSPQGERNWIHKILYAKREEEGLDWSGKRGGNVEMKWDVAPPKNQFENLAI